MISVCIATYNGDKYIKEEIDSILPQLSPEDEIVVSDDGSTDSTLQILNSYNDSRIKIFSHTKRKNKYHFDYTTHNFENAISNAKGEYIFLADQDDVWLQDKVKCMVEALQTSDIVISDSIVTDKDLNELRKTRYQTKGPSNKVIRCLLSNNNPGCCMAFRRKVIDTVLPFPKHGVAQDFWIAVYGGMYHTLSYIHKPLILFRRHDTNVSSSMGKSSASLSFKIGYRIDELSSLIKRAGIWKVIKNLR